MLLSQALGRLARSQAELVEKAVVLSLPVLDGGSEPMASVSWCQVAVPGLYQQ
jgi:hypothetical protein